MKVTAILVFGLLEVVVGAPQYCTSDGECASSQCCTEPIFGRKRFIFTESRGTCQALAGEGETCEPDLMVFGGSQSHSFGCPCAEGLECHGESESHQGGSHSYTNPRCVPAGSAGTSSGTATGSGGVNTATQTNMPATEPPPHTADPNQPIEELPGK